MPNRSVKLHSMEFGVHLPLIAFDKPDWSLAALRDYARAARDLGYSAVAANDHLVFPRPWLDGPTALASALDETGDMDLFTSVSIPVVRGPLQTAKVLAAIDVLSGGRLIAGIGPGSSEFDYRAVDVPFAERWKRVDDAVKTMRAIWAGEKFTGRFYSTPDLVTEPRPVQHRLPIWIGSWGSEAGLRRVARLADGWLASGYNTTPALFGPAWESLQGLLRTAGRDSDGFPNGLATVWTFVSEDRKQTARILDGLASFLRRSRQDLQERLPIGPAEECTEKLAAYRDAGLQRVLLWPVAEERRQIEVFAERVRPRLMPAG